MNNHNQHNIRAGQVNYVFHLPSCIFQYAKAILYNVIDLQQNRGKRVLFRIF